jgi:hypothetical protein
VRVDNTMQDTVFGVARLIPGARERHACGIRRANGRGQCRKRDTSKALGERGERRPQAGRPLPSTPLERNQRDAEASRGRAESQAPMMPRGTRWHCPSLIGPRVSHHPGVLGRGWEIVQSPGAWSCTIGPQ